MPSSYRAPSALTLQPVTDPVSSELILAAKLNSTIGAVTLSAASADVVFLNANSKTTSVTLTGAVASGSSIYIQSFTGTLSISGATFNASKVNLNGCVISSLALRNGIDDLVLGTNGNGFTTLTSAATNWPNTIAAASLAGLATVTITATAVEATSPVGAVSFNGCALSSASVDSICAFYASLIGGTDLSGLQLDLSGGTNSAPSVGAAANIVLIQGAGGTVTTN